MSQVLGFCSKQNLAIYMFIPWADEVAHIVCQVLHWAHTMSYFSCFCLKQGMLHFSCYIFCIGSFCFMLWSFLFLYIFHVFDVHLHLQPSLWLRKCLHPHLHHHHRCWCRISSIGRQSMISKRCMGCLPMSPCSSTSTPETINEATHCNIWCIPYPYLHSHILLKKLKNIYV